MLLTLFVLAFGKPKPFHSVIIKNWKKIPDVKFVLITNYSECWQELVQDQKQFKIVQISIESFFSYFFKFLDCDNFNNFSEKYGSLFDIKRHPISGWLACTLRPCLCRFIKPETLWWGWIDWDVFIDKKSISESLNSSSFDAFYFPKQGCQWEQFKVFRSNLPIDEIYLKTLNENHSKNIYLGQPLDVHVIYKIRSEGLFSLDDSSIEEFAVHWEYTNKHNLPHVQKNVLLDSSYCNLLDENNTCIKFFMADIQGKKYGQNEVDLIFDKINNDGYFIFNYNKD